MLKTVLSLLIGSVILLADAPMGMWSDTTHNTISLGWNDSDDETAYRIYAVGNTTPLVELAQNTVSYEVNDIHGIPLAPITMYQFKITAIIGGVEVEHPALQITNSTTTHVWNNGPFKTCINSWIGIDASETPTKNQLESLDSNRMIFCTNRAITDISPIGDLKYIMAISLENNLLTMTTAAPLASLTQLGLLILAKNNLNGAIPSWIGTMPNMDHLDLSDTNLSGSIPSWITNLSHMSDLRLYNNNLTGAIPTDVGKWAGLYSLYLGDNKLSGVIPAQLGTLTGLRHVDLKNNSLTGVIPSGITNNDNLFLLDLSNNKLSGVIPPNLDDLTNLGSVNLSHNELTGAIPSIGVNSFPNNGINFSHNKLTGSIPSSIGQIFNLRSLHLDNNRLKGEIPSSIENLSNINVGDLSMNYNCDLYTDSASLKNYLDNVIVTGYDGIVDTNGNCGVSFSPSIIMYLLN